MNWGMAGLEYWVSEQNEQWESEFFGVTRNIRFVRQEEDLKKKIPDDSLRAYYDMDKESVDKYIKGLKKKGYWRE